MLQSALRLLLRSEGDTCHMEPVYPPLADGRLMDIWEPLARIAKLAGGEWPGKVELTAKLLTGERRHQADDTRGVRLLGDIRQVLNGNVQITSAALVTALHNLSEADWGE
jgi:Protein of unknown function (DUF3631)